MMISKVTKRLEAEKRALAGDSSLVKNIILVISVLLIIFTTIYFTYILKFSQWKLYISLGRGMVIIEGVGIIQFFIRLRQRIYSTNLESILDYLD